MESANFHRQQEDHHHFVASSFSWSQHPILNTTNNIINSRNLDTSTNSLAQNFIFPYNNSMGYPVENITHELQCFARTDDIGKFSEAESYPKFLELLNCSPTSSNTEDYSTYLKNNNQEVMLLNDQKCSNGILSQILPTITVSSSNICNNTTSSLSSSSSSSLSSSSTISSTSFDMNCLPALDIFGSPRFDGAMSYGYDRMIQPNHRPLVCPSKTTSVSTTERTDQSAKRPASKYVDAKETQSVASKKSKLEPRSSSAPFQVRKHKLGDKVAAIQQLVAPFGKTDTASVLMEAIGYIKFLQTQVETLSVPYTKSTNKICGISSELGQMIKDENGEAKRDLRSRGLCLVPQSCLSYVTDGCDPLSLDHSQELE
ncbi:uncharacterized protein LOC143543697 [Bidens hawaiensis]|uniref:uncharacterized protein LOC143543697 n=1 Tax=Bidens hawaiensis TaxID=980011 RepID=UPI00404B6636